MQWWHWLIAGGMVLVLVASLVSSWRKSRAMERLEKALTKALAEVDALKGQMQVFVGQMRQSLQLMEEERARLLRANAALMEANRNAYETLTSVLTAPGVPAAVGGDILRRIAEAGPSTANRDSDPGGLPPVTPAARRKPPGAQ